jgi:hypothetical protein
MRTAADVRLPAQLRLAGDLASIARKLFAYCRAADWAGYDPYDALNSRWLRAWPSLDRRVFRLALTQLLKRAPINVRPLLGIAPVRNAKALALMLSACVALARRGVLPASAVQDSGLVAAITAMRCADRRNACWGYSFPWQTRTRLVPRGAPNLVCTIFVANALLDAFEHQRDPVCLTLAASAARYLIDDLYWTDAGGDAGFAYPLPSSRSHIHNADLLAAALLLRVAAHTGSHELAGPALKVAQRAAREQQQDGSWYYGQLPTQQWKDNFHTGFVLCALQAIAESARTREFEGTLRRGFEFYRTRFFRADGAPRYFADRTYPIDTHCAAQAVITLLRLRHLDPSSVPMAVATLRFMTAHMWSERGYFYYRKLPVGTNRIPYMRWSQAWMLLALATALECLVPANAGCAMASGQA